MPRVQFTSCFLLFLAIGGLLSSPLAFAQKIGADPAACQGELSICSQHLKTYSFVSLTEGNVAETYSTARVTSTFGPTLMFNLIYNSYNADGTRASIDSGIGYGWTHTYNDFLFSQGNDMFRMGPDGRVTEFTFSNGSYQAAPGYFETLVLNNDGSFTITTKHQTKFQYQSVSSGRFRSAHSAISGTIFSLTSITDPNNNVTTLTYSGGNLATVTDTFGRSLTLAYNGNSHLSSVTDPLGRVTTFSYDSTGTQLVTITDALGKTTNFTYNSLDQIINKTDRDGRLFTTAYQFNLPYSEVDAHGATVYSLTNASNWATDPNQLNQFYLRVYIPSTTSRTDGRANIWKYAYDSNGFPLTITAPDGTTTTYTYNANTLEVASETDANGRTTSYQYDSEGNLTQLTDANGNITKYTYESVFNQMTSMTDPNGRTTTYTYDSHGNRISETDPLGQTAQWTYDSRGNVLTATDKRGNTTTYVYDANGDRITATDSLGEVTQYTYDNVGNCTSTTDPNDHTTTYQFDSLDRVTLVTDALAGTKKTSYDGEGDVIKVTDQDGNSTGYSYDQRLRMITTTDALGKQTTYTFDGNDNRVSMTDRNGHEAKYSYDVQNRLSSTTDALGDVSSSTYDGVGNTLTETDANFHTTTYVYDQLNRRTQKSDALNEVTTWGYDLTGLPGCPACTGPTLGSSKITKQTDCNGKVIYWAFDGLDRLVIKVRKQGATNYGIGPNDAVTRYAYDPNSNRTSMMDPVGNTTTYSYDSVNRQDQMVNAAGDTWTTTYDSKGNVKTVTTPNLNVTTNTYDALDRLIQVDDSIGRVANNTYDPVGNQLTNKDGNGNGTTNTYDADYRVTAVTDALNQTTLYAFDAVGNLLTTTDRQGNVTTNRYDNINRRISTTNAVGAVTQYLYDPVSNVVSIIDGNNNATNYTFDAVNRLIKETYADGTMRSYTYDCTGHLKSRTDQNGQTTNCTYSDLYFLLQFRYPVSAPDNFTYDLTGKLLTAEKGGWNDTFVWDARNYPIQAVQNGQSVGYTYNIPGGVSEVFYPKGEVIVETTDARARLSEISSLNGPKIVQYNYDRGNNVSSRVYPFGSISTPIYNANNWVTSLNHIIPLDGTRIAGFDYAYDHQGNKLFEQKRRDSAPARSEVYGVNSIYQMTNFNVATQAPPVLPNTPGQRTQFTIDPVGNPTVETTNGVQQTRHYNSVNEITSINGVPLTYDNNGNLIGDSQYQYAYDENNNLIQVSTQPPNSTVVAAFRVDALGRRVEKVGSPSATFYFHDGLRIISAQDAVGNEKATYVYGNGIDEVLEEFQHGYFYFQNALGSVMAVTDATGNVLERYTYGAYGTPTITNGAGERLSPNLSGPAHSAIGNPWMFTGRYFDEETGLLFYRTRYLDTFKGRYLQRDRLGIWGDRGNLGNGYAYVGNNPTGATDPLGLWWITLDGVSWLDEFLCNCSRTDWSKVVALVVPGGSGGTGSKGNQPGGFGSASASMSSGASFTAVNSSYIDPCGPGGTPETCLEKLRNPGGTWFANASFSLAPVPGPGSPPPGDPIDCYFHPWHPGCPWSLPPILGMTTMTTGGTDPSCQWTPAAPGCPLHICTIEPSLPQCAGGIWSSSVNFNNLDYIEPTPGPSSNPLNCLRHPEDCLDFPSPQEPLPSFMQSYSALRPGGSGTNTGPTNGTPPAMMMMNVGSSSSYLDPCGPWGTPADCAYSKTPAMGGATW